MWAISVTGSCHCGKVTLSIAEAPSWVVECGCSICAKLGVLWHYLPDGDDWISGETIGYLCNKRVIAFHHCPTCGCTTHWRTLGTDFGKMAINARLLDDFDASGVQVRVIAGPTPAAFADNWP